VKVAGRNIDTTLQDYRVIYFYKKFYSIGQRKRKRNNNNEETIALKQHWSLWIAVYKYLYGWKSSLSFNCRRRYRWASFKLRAAFTRSIFRCDFTMRFCTPCLIGLRPIFRGKDMEKMDWKIFHVNVLSLCKYRLIDTTSYISALRFIHTSYQDSAIVQSIAISG